MQPRIFKHEDGGYDVGVGLDKGHEYGTILPELVAYHEEKKRQGAGWFGRWRAWRRIGSIASFQKKVAHIQSEESGPEFQLSPEESGAVEQQLARGRDGEPEKDAERRQVMYTVITQTLGQGHSSLLAAADNPETPQP